MSELGNFAFGVKWPLLAAPTENQPQIIDKSLRRKLFRIKALGLA